MSTHFATKTGRVAAGGSLLVGGVAGALVLAPQAGAATTFTVTNTADSGAGSLRQALDDANDNAGADIIVFDASAAGTITLTTGDILIEGDVSITGLGATNSIISGNNITRIFYMYDEGARTISISGLTLTDGSSGSAGGGAIYSKGIDLTLSGVVITGNDSNYRGGGVYFGDLDGRNPSLTIIDSEISDNTAGNDGGGLFLYSVGDVSITNTVVSGNTSDDSGGGAYFYQVGNVSIDSSIFDQNTAVDDGGGLCLYNLGDVTITNTVVSGNTSDDRGGGAYFYSVGNVSIDSTTFDQNTAVDDGGGVRATYSDSFTMTNSTVSGNEAEDGAGLRLSNNGDILIANSTIANNVGAAQGGYGGALYLAGSSGDLRIMFSTISGNSSEDTVVRLYDSQFTAEITGTIISDNTTGSGSGLQAEDLYLGSNSSFTATNSLIMGETFGGVFSDGGGNVFGVSAQLGALADNGGATFTMEPTAGSPVIDAGPLTWTAFTGDGSDQRGGLFLRVYNGQSDMGALEVQSDPAPPTTTTTVGTDPMIPTFTG
jgi:predicted outer membrane repeat protein